MTITKAELQEYAKLNAERLDLEREAATKDERCKQIKAKALEVLKASGKASIIRHGFTIAWAPGRSKVAWKDAFLLECGPDKANALQDAAMAERPQVLQITPPVEK